MDKSNMPHIKVTMVVTDQDDENAESIRKMLGLAEKAQAVSYALGLAKRKLEANVPTQTMINPMDGASKRLDEYRRKQNMPIAEAVELVLKLARDNLCFDSKAELDRHTTACAVLEDFAVNHLGDD